jgi:hypothetical protein
MPVRFASKPVWEPAGVACLDVFFPHPPFGTYRLRESPSIHSLGQITMTATNGGFLMNGFIQAFLEFSYDGAFWYPASSSTYLELSGPPGIPAFMSISQPLGGNIQLCWTSQAGAHYQLQQNSTTGSVNWTNIDVPVSGNGSNICFRPVCRRHKPVLQGADLTLSNIPS